MAGLTVPVRCQWSRQLRAGKQEGPLRLPFLLEDWRELLLPVTPRSFYGHA
jgi:hypothetical protein